MSTGTLPFIDLGKQFSEYEAEIDTVVRNVMQSGCFILGPEVEDFEKELAEWVGVPYCVACASGTDALVLALRACGVGQGDEVITSPFTFFATAEAVTMLGAKPVFADIRPDTFTIDPDCIRNAVTERTRAIIPVSLFGQPSDMDEIASIADERGIAIIEDAAQSMGAKYRGRRSGNLSPLAATSFYPTKPLGCYGDGGAVLTREKGFADEIRLLRNHGQSAGYVHVRIGLNSRLDAIQAAVLRVKLRHLEEEVGRRREVATRYGELLSGIPGCTAPRIGEERESVYAQYSVLVDERDSVALQLREAGIPTAVHYPKPVYLQQPYEKEGEYTECPVAEEICSRILSLPMHAFLEEPVQIQIIDRLARILKGGRHEAHSTDRVRFDGAQSLPHSEPVLTLPAGGGL